MECWIIYRQDAISINQAFMNFLSDASEKEGFSPKVILWERLTMSIVCNEPRLFYMNKLVIDLPAFSINRCADFKLSKHMEKMGIKVFNNSKVCEICNDKALTHQFLSMQGIPMMDSLFLHKAQISCDNISFEYPFIIKPTKGAGGLGVSLIENNKVLNRYLGQIKSDGFVVQRIAGIVGKDLRVYVIGKQIIAAILRTSETDFRANYSLGGKFQLYVLSDVEREVVERIIDKFEFGLVGIDFIFDGEGGLVFNEIEDAVGCRTLYQASDLNIAELYISYIVKNL